MTHLRKFLVPLALLAATAFSAHAAASANLVANGSFEQGPGGIGSFTGWDTALGDATTFVDSSGQTGPHYGQASDGLWAAYFGSTAADGGATISQSIATQAGQQYVLSFDFANDNGGGGAANALAVGLAGQTVFGFASVVDQDYVHESFSFTAAAGSTLLSFAAHNDNGYLELDNVRVSAVPEPAAVQLMFAGLLLAASLRAAKGHGRR